MIKKKFNGGSFECCLDKYTQKLRLRSAVTRSLISYLQENKLDNATNDEILAEVLDNLEGYVNNIKIGKKKSTYDDLLKHPPAADCLYDISIEIADGLYPDKKKAEQLKTSQP